MMNGIPTNKYLRNKKIINHVGHFSNVYVIEIENYQKTILNKLKLNFEYTNIDKNFVDIFIKEQNELIIFNGKSFTIFDNIENKENYRENDIDELLDDNTIYNCVETCLLYFCNELINELVKNNYTIISTDYPKIYFTKKDSKMDDLIKLLENKLNNIIPTKIIHIFTDFYKYHDYNTNLGLYENGEIYIEGSNHIFNDKELVTYFLKNKYEPPKRINIKKSLYKKQDNVIFNDEMWKYKYLYECFNTDDYLVYVFFDIDIDSDLNYNMKNIWDEKMIKYECNKLNEELNQIFNIKFDFAISYSIRSNKLSIHLVSTNVILNNLNQFKKIIQNIKFESLFGQNIDPLVYRNNGSLRVGGTYKEQENKIYDRDTLLMLLNYKYKHERKNHFINKKIHDECILITNQTYYYKENIKKENILEKNTFNNINYSRYNLVIDKLIDEHFNYENCISDYNQFFIFVYIVASITDGSEKYLNILLNKLNKLSDIIKNKTKISILKYNFKNYKKFIEKNNLHTSINYLLRKYKILNYSNINANNIDIKYIDSKYLTSNVVDIDSFYKSNNNKMFIKSQMGTGKTEIVMNFLKNKNISISVLIICTRRSMISEFKKRFNLLNLEYISICSNDNFSKEINKLENSNISIFISTCESLWKLNDFFPKFDLVICDEIESISTQMCSKMTHKSKIELNNVVFQKYINSGKLICMDGLMTENIIKILVNEKDNILLIHNTFEVEKEIKEIKSLKKYICYILDIFKNNKNISIACDSKILSISLYELLSNKKYDKQNIDDNFIIYNSDTSSTIDITKIDMTNKTIIYTPSMDVSVSITDFTPDYVFGFFINEEVSTFSKIQMLMRFRNTKNIILHIKNKFLKKNDDETTNDLLFTEYFDDYFNNEYFNSSDLLNHICKLDKFKFKDVQRKEKKFFEKMKNSLYYNFLYHEAFKKNISIRKNIKITNFDINLEIDIIKYNLFKEIYSNNKEYYYLIQHIDTIETEIMNRYNILDNDINVSILLSMNEYNKYRINSKSTNDLVIKSLISTIYFETKTNNIIFDNINDFKQNFLSNNLHIKLFYNIIKSTNNQKQLLLYYILTSLKVVNSRKVISFEDIIDKTSKINNSYFKKLTKSKIKLISKKYFNSLHVI